MRRRERGFRSGGFTLIELLVVISIIALLIGLLLPALNKSRVVAWSAMGLANQRGCFQATDVYGSDNNDSLVPAFSMVEGRCTDLSSNSAFIDGADPIAAGSIWNGLPPVGGCASITTSARLWADYLLEGSYVTTPGIFTDPGKPATYTLGSAAVLIPAGGTPAYRTINLTDGTVLPKYQAIGYGCSYQPTGQFYYGSYRSGGTGLQYYDTGPLTGSGYNLHVTKFVKLSNRPYPSQNMWLMDSCGNNTPTTATLWGYPNNGTRGGSIATTDAVYFDGHAATLQNANIYPSSNGNMLLTPNIAGPGADGTEWPDSVLYPNFVGRRFWDIRNTTPMGGPSAFGSLDALNVTEHQVDP